MKFISNGLAVLLSLAVLGGLIYGVYYFGHYVLGVYTALEKPAQITVAVTCLSLLVISVVITLIARSREQTRLRGLRADAYGSLLSVIQMRLSPQALPDGAPADALLAQRLLLLCGSRSVIHFYADWKDKFEVDPLAESTNQQLGHLLSAMRRDLNVSPLTDSRMHLVRLLTTTPSVPSGAAPAHGSTLRGDPIEETEPLENERGISDA